tara:strand:+ start:2592 stop:3164 length:573 start_codon:yes stop_codon:yes gene_type:complete
MKINAVYKKDGLKFLKQIPTNFVNLVLTDPPYDLDDSTKKAIHKQFLRVCKGSVIVFSPPENQWIQPADEYLFWVRPSITKYTIRGYSRFVEMVFVYGKSKIWNCNKHWSNYTNVFMDIVDDAKQHPHRKPISLITRLLLNHSNPGNIVLDVFAGSGTVLEVAKLYKRRYVGCEHDPAYFRLIQKHLKNF